MEKEIRTLMETPAENLVTLNKKELNELFREVRAKVCYLRNINRTGRTKLEKIAQQIADLEASYRDIEETMRDIDENDSLRKAEARLREVKLEQEKRIAENIGETRKRRGNIRRKKTAENIAADATALLESLGL